MMALIAPPVAPGRGALLGPTNKGKEVIRKAATGEPRRRKQKRRDDSLLKDKCVSEQGISDKGEALLKVHGLE
jgi:hypothetical protein